MGIIDMLINRLLLLLKSLSKLRMLMKFAGMTDMNLTIHTLT